MPVPLCPCLQAAAQATPASTVRVCVGNGKTSEATACSAWLRKALPANTTAAVNFECVYETSEDLCLQRIRSGGADLVRGGGKQSTPSISSAPAATSAPHTVPWLGCARPPQEPSKALVALVQATPGRSTSQHSRPLQQCLLCAALPPLQAT